MAGPKRQHFIPQSYLRNFSTSFDNDDKAFVEAMNVKSREIKFPFSIKNICVSKNIYTIPNVPDTDKYFLEHYYANNVDAIYPEVYRMLTDDSIVEISESDREKILSTTLSLYFRTSKFLDEKNAELDDLMAFIGRQKERFKDSDKILNVYFGDRNYSFKVSEAEEATAAIKLNNKMDFIVGHFKDWQNFVRHKYFSQITVHKVTDEVSLITCDNPVQINNHKYKTTDVFDQNNSIQLPLDEHHLLWISPNTQQTERNIIYRGLRDKWFAITSNHTSEENATDWIIGKENSLAKHVTQQEQNKIDSSENRDALESIKSRSSELFEFVQLVQKHGMDSDAAIGKFKELHQNPYFQSDPQFQIMLKEMKARGYA